MKNILKMIDMWCIFLIVVLIYYTSWYTALGFVCLCIPFIYSIKIMRNILLCDLSVVTLLSMIMYMLLSKRSLFIPSVFPIFILSVELFIFIYNTFEYFRSGIESLTNVDSVMDFNKQRSLFGYIFTFKLVLIVGVYMFVSKTLGIWSVLGYSCLFTLVLSTVCYILVVNIIMSSMFKKRISKLMVDNNEN